MKNSAQFVLSGLLHGCPPEQRAQLLNYLPENERMELQRIPPPQKPILLDAFATDAFIDEVHYSWFIPTLKSYSKREAGFFLLSLQKEMAADLKKKLNVPLPKIELSEQGKNYLRNVLARSLIEEGESLLPEEYLPASPLNDLLLLDKNDLISLINFLSLYDLAAELRQIVDTKILKKINEFLTEKERTFIKKKTNVTESISLGRMGLDRWDGDEETLKVLLHRRGLRRFSLALTGQNSDLIWYICHQLDIGRGNALYKNIGKEIPTSVRESLVMHIIELIPVVQQG